MKYYWPLVMIGGTLLVLGAALPWTTYCGGLPSIDIPYCRSVTGFQGGGLLPAVGGGILLLIALVESGEHGSPSLALIVSVLCGLLLLGGACLQLQVICGDCPTYSPAFGVGVSVAGAVLSIIGSLMPLPAGDTMNSPDIVLPMVLESCSSSAPGWLSLRTLSLATGWVSGIPPCPRSHASGSSAR